MQKRRTGICSLKVTWHSMLTAVPVAWHKIKNESRNLFAWRYITPLRKPKPYSSVIKYIFIYVNFPNHSNLKKSCITHIAIIKPNHEQFHTTLAYYFFFSFFEITLIKLHYFSDQSIHCMPARKMTQVKNYNFFGYVVQNKLYRLHPVACVKSKNVTVDTTNKWKIVFKWRQAYINLYLTYLLYA
jgi:hypothetical protein